MSDEQGTRPQYLSLARHTKLLLHQYHHAAYDYPCNSLQLPLGYATGFLSGGGRGRLRAPDERTFNAAFVGQLKLDRGEMIAAFQKLDGVAGRHVNLVLVETIWNIKDLAVSPHDTYNMYSDAIFVPIGRGFVSLDCFRIYEAIAAGAIPVVVGPPHELAATFPYNELPLPLITADSWDAAGPGLLHDARGTGAAAPVAAAAE